MAKYLASLLVLFTGQCEHQIKKSADFVNFVKTLQLASTDRFISFDVVSFFMQVPLADPLESLKPLFTIEIIKLFEFVLTS